MQKIPLIQAKAGMVVDRDVFRGNVAGGMPVCGRGTELSDSLINRLDNMEVKTIYVEGHPVWEEGECSLEELLANMDYRFSRTMQNPLNLVLRDIFRASLIKSMGGNLDRQAE